MISIPTSLADIREKQTQKNEITALFYKIKAEFSVLKKFLLSSFGKSTLLVYQPCGRRFSFLNCTQSLMKS